MTFARAAIRKIVLDVLEDKLYRHGLHTGGSFGFELDSDQKNTLMMEIADAVAEQIAVAPAEPDKEP